MGNPIARYRKSSINTISIRYGNETIIINVSRAAKISEDSLESEIKNQPSYYGFLFILHKRLLTRFEQLKLRRQQVYGQLLGKAKERKNSFNRPISDTAAEKWVKAHKKYIAASQDCINARDQADQVLGAVRAFEMRAALMQTLSSNLRKER